MARERQRERRGVRRAPHQRPGPARAGGRGASGRRQAADGDEVPLDYAPTRDVQGPQTSVMVNPRVLDHETLVAVNQLKLHRTATVTLALKNIAMSYPAADYYGHPRSRQDHRNWFYDDMHSFIAVMAKRFPIGVHETRRGERPARLPHGFGYPQGGV